MLMPRSANGLASEASTPTASNGSAPPTLRQRQFLSAMQSGGMRDSSQTIDNSRDVRVIDTNLSSPAHSGMESVGSRRQTAKRSGS